MLGFGKKSIVTSTEPPAPTPSVTGDVGGFHIHTIPSKFLPKAVSLSSSHIRRVVIWVPLILFVSGLLILASSLLVKSVRTNEAVRIENSVTIPKPENVNAEPPAVTVLIQRDIGTCRYSPSSSAIDQALTVGTYQVKGYTASYFCETGSLAVQVLQFSDAAALAGRIQDGSLNVRVLRGDVMQDAKDQYTMMWGSGISFIQLTLNSLVPDDTNVALFLDEYLRLYPATPGLPWNTVSTPVLRTPEERDSRRIADIKKIQIALEFYKIDKEAYPTFLDQTVDQDLRNYLAEIPQNPEPGGKPYFYVQKLGGQSYEISFSLEEGNATVPAGEAVARPQGIFGKRPEMKSLLPGSPDTDNDGLTDVEETLWRTDPSRSDTDQDTYPDGKEIKDGYDPITSGAARLASSGLVKNYLSPAFPVSLLYPTAWTAEEGQGQITFYSEDKNDFFGILVEEGTGISSLIEWYRSEFPASSDTEVNMVTLSGQPAVASPDGLTAYAVFSGKLYTVTYNPGIKETLDYQATFQMFLSTFRFFENPSS